MRGSRQRGSSAGSSTRASPHGCAGERWSPPRDAPNERSTVSDSDTARAHRALTREAPSSRDRTGSAHTLTLGTRVGLAVLIGVIAGVLTLLVFERANGAASRGPLGQDFTLWWRGAQAVR